MRSEWLAERVRALPDGTLTPVAPRPAATVVLLRNARSGQGVEVYLLRRVAAMAFAAGMHVFPGGSVDPEDRAAPAGPGAWAGPSLQEWAAALGCAEPLARGLVRAAVRETFEECGVLLAGDAPGTVLGDVSTPEWEAERAALEARKQSLSQLLARRRLVLRGDLLRPLARWITPAAEPKRFDTWFFLAALPGGQVCRDVGGEADARLWIRPREALDRGLALMPPTAAALSAVADAPDAATALAVEPAVEPVLPELVLGRDGVVLRMPRAAPVDGGGVQR